MGLKFKMLKCANRGFTLIELLVAMVVAMLVMAAIYAAYQAQQRTYFAQDQVVEMQMNGRAALSMLMREIRMAGYDPTKSSGAGITAANSHSITFSHDLTDDAGTGDGDGDIADPGENVIFGFATGVDILPNPDPDGIPDQTINGVHVAAPLARSTDGGATYELIAENIQAIEFQYLDLADAVTTNPAEVRSVQISILVRANLPDKNYTDGKTYTPASGVAWDLNGAATPGNAANDNYRRKLLITTVQCRNIGL